MLDDFYIPHLLLKLTNYIYDYNCDKSAPDVQGYLRLSRLLLCLPVSTKLNDSVAKR